MSTQQRNTAVHQTMRDFYQEDPPMDATPVRLADEASDTVASKSLMAQLSPVWRRVLVQTSFQRTKVVQLGLTRAQYEAAKGVWLHLMVSHPHPPELKRKSAAFAIKLLIALDMLQIHPSVVEYVTKHAQTALTVRDVAEVVADPEISAMPDDVLELLMPTLLERPKGLHNQHIANGLVKRAIKEAKQHIDRRGLVWINRQRSATEATAYHLRRQPDGQPPILLPGKNPAQSVRAYDRIAVIDVLPLDDTRVMCRFLQKEGVHAESHFVACFDTATGEMVGRPQTPPLRNYDRMLMNGRHFIFPDDMTAHVHNRTLDFFHAAPENNPPQQILTMPALARMHTLCGGVSDLLFIENRQEPYTLTVLKCTDAADDAYVQQYVISLQHFRQPVRSWTPTFKFFGGLVLSPTRLVLHMATEEELGQIRMKLQLFERDAPVCPPCDMGHFYEGAAPQTHRNDGTECLCYRLGRIYFLQNQYRIFAFDAGANDLSAPLSAVAFDNEGALAAYGARILVLPSDATYAKSRVLLFDPRTGKIADGMLTLPHTMVRKTVALKGGNILFASYDGEFYVVKRVE